MNEKKFESYHLIMAIFLTLIVYMIGFSIERSKRTLHSYEKVYEKKAYECDSVYIYKYYIEENTLIDLESGAEYNLMNECKERK